MVKKLREYNKQILAGVSALLLIVFLAPTAVQQCTRANARPSTVWATTKDGSKLTLGEREELRPQLAVLEVLGDPVASTLGLAKNPDHWWLLVKEAKDAGLVGGPSDGRALLEGLAARTNRKPDDLLAILSAQTRQPMNSVLTTLADLRGVYRLAELVTGSSRLGDARARLAARELLTDVTCEIVPIDAALVGDAVPVAPPTPDQLAEVFNAGKSSLSGAGPNGTGYKFPDRIKLEWLFIAAPEVARAMASDPALGQVELRKEFLRNPTAYGAPAAESSPNFDQYKDKVRDAVQRRLVRERGERIAAAVREWNRAATKDFPVEGGVIKLPADWRERVPTFAKLAEELTNKLALPLPRVDSSGPNWMTPADLDANAFLGKATTSEFGQPQALSALVKGLREFDANTRMPLQAGIVGPMLVTPNDDMIIWRVTEAQPSHEPAALDEVRDQVLRDTTAKLRYAELAKRANDILAAANKDGMAAVARTYGTTVENATGVHLADPNILRQFGARFAGSLPKAGQDADAIRAVVAKAATLPSDKPIASVPDADRTLAVPVEKRLALLIARITDVKPLTIEDYQEFGRSGRLQAALGQDDTRVDPIKVLSAEATEKRLGFVRMNPQGPDRVAPSDAPAF